MVPLSETEGMIIVAPETELKEAVEDLMISLSSSSSDHLLPCLQKLEDCLMKMESSQSKDIQDASGCAVHALASKELLNHHDLHVRISVASCFCHLLRMTVLDAPFGSDELLKEVLGLVVSAFDYISDTSSGLYHKRISILKTFAKARLFIRMVDLECDELIVDMFKCFLRNIRENQPDAVFSSMGLIMILTVKKMKHVPFELALTLLQTVRNGDEVISPVARKLAERVLENCDLKLAPCLSEAVQHLGFPLDDYSRIVVRVCSRQFESQAKTEVLGSEDDASEENVCISKPKASKLNPVANRYVTPMKSIESNADKRRGRRKSGSSNKSCAEAVKIRVNIRNGSPAKLIKEASSCSLPITKARNVSARKVCGQTNGISLSAGQPLVIGCTSSAKARSSIGRDSKNGVPSAANAANEQQGSSTGEDAAMASNFGGSCTDVHAQGSIFKIRFLKKLGDVRGEEKHAPERDCAIGQNVNQSNKAANDSLDMQNGSSSKDGSEAKAKADSPTRRAQTTSNKKAGTNCSPDDMPLSALRCQNSKKTRSAGRRQPRHVGAELPGPNAAGDKSSASKQIS